MPEVNPSGRKYPYLLQGIPEALHGPVQYALEMLLLPLGVHPERITSAEVGPGTLVYGPSPPEREDVHFLPMHPSTWRFICSRQAYPAEAARWTTAHDVRWPVLFPLREVASEGTVDPVAEAFFWLSDWQAQGIRRRDVHGRLTYCDSLQHRLGIPPLPVVDRLREELARRLQLKPRSWGGHTWAFAPTHDIDYVRLWRPGILYRELVEYALLNRRKVSLSARLRRLGRVLALLPRRDPYTEGLFSMIRQAPGTFFFKAGAHGPRDVPYRLSRRAVRRAFQAIKGMEGEIALHPSYHAATHPRYLTEEKNRLERQSGCPVHSVRQHYLRWMPEVTPRLQHEAGLMLDSTLAFPDHEGFRNGTCLPFRLWDPVRMEPLHWALPLAVMDSTLFHYRGLDVEAAFTRIQDILRWVRRFSGIGVALWHEMLYDPLDRPGWSSLIPRTLQEAEEGGALVGPLYHLLDQWLQDHA